MKLFSKEKPTPFHITITLIIAMFFYFYDHATLAVVIVLASLALPYQFKESSPTGEANPPTNKPNVPFYRQFLQAVGSLISVGIGLLASVCMLIALTSHNSPIDEMIPDVYLSAPLQILVFVLLLVLIISPLILSILYATMRIRRQNAKYVPPIEKSDSNQ